MKHKSLNLLFWVGVAILILPSLVYGYLLMPFPGSQDLEVISFTYYLHKILLISRIAGILLILFPLWKTIIGGKTKEKVIKAIVLLLCFIVFYYLEVEFKAEKMFEEPKVVKFELEKNNRVPDSLLVIGIVHEGIAKAYPLNYLGYHHKVQDSVGSMPVLVTYCTMCRTGRVYSPVIKGKHQAFRLVGARHYNAVIEDEDTKTWWYQATGEAAVGPLRGSALKDIDYEQVTLRSWLQKYPHTLILQPDPNYQEGYDHLKNYDRRQPVDKDPTISKDTLTRKSWIVGITIQSKYKAYNWKELTRRRVVNDVFNKTPILLTLEDDTLSYHAWSRLVDGEVLAFETDGAGIKDTRTGAHWSYQGICEEGINKGKRLVPIQAHQEYWHSWKFFHPSTSL